MALTRITGNSFFWLPTAGYKLSSSCVTHCDGRNQFQQEVIESKEVKIQK